MTWQVERETQGILRLVLGGSVTEAEMTEFLRAHNAAVDDFHGAEYRVMCDIRGLRPLSPGCADLMERAKTYSASHPNFQGSAVLVSSPTVAMQHQRTSTSGGVSETELTSDDETECITHLTRIHRQPAAELPSATTAGA